MNSISVSSAPSSRVLGFASFWANVILPAPWEAALESMIFDLLINMQEVLFSYCPIPLFSALASLHYCFSRCAAGDRGQPHPFTEWHSMRRRKGREEILLGTSPNEQINASVPQGMQEWGRIYWDPEDQAKAFTQKQLPQSMNRSLFTLAQQYISLKPVIGQNCN